MTAENENQQSNQQDQASSQGQSQQTTQTQDQSQQTTQAQDQSSRSGTQANGEVVAAPERSVRRREPSEVFDPRAATRVGLLRLGQHCQESGSTYGAIYAYTKVLERYPGRGAASAAVEELVSMANELMDQQKFYTALHIFDLLEELM